MCALCETKSSPVLMSFRRFSGRLVYNFCLLRRCCGELMSIGRLKNLQPVQLGHPVFSNHGFPRLLHDSVLKRPFELKTQ